jgi:chromosome segregation ATPase
MTKEEIEKRIDFLHDERQSLKDEIYNIEDEIIELENELRSMK